MDGPGENGFTSGSQSRARIFDIQKFAIHDGPGIRTLVFFKGCPLRCPWCSNPESQSPARELVLYPNRCIGCLQCIDACPHGAIQRARDGLVITDRSACQACGTCSECCHAEARVLVGQSMTTEEIMREIRKDAVFYRKSGGGVTLGGGEVLLWADFAAHLLRLCREEGISTRIETCGHAPWQSLEALIPWADAWYYDVKHLDSVTHQHLTGVSNKLILENLERLAATGATVTVRVPIVPGYTDDVDNVRGIASQITRRRLTQIVELLPYHRFGEDKYARLGLSYGLADVSAPSEETMTRLRQIVEDEGLQCRVGG